MSKEEHIKQLKSIALLLSSVYNGNLQIEINVQNNERKAKVTVKEVNL